jgi:hypothetical protein
LALNRPFCRLSSLPFCQGDRCCFFSPAAGWHLVEGWAGNSAGPAEEALAGIAAEPVGACSALRSVGPVAAEWVWPQEAAGTAEQAWIAEAAAG